MSRVPFYEMGPADNILYFPNNVDVRICPKNGMSSLKELHRINRGVEQYIGRVDRLSKVRSFSDQFDIPFRRGSYRIAVKRDPIGRFKSACEYIVRNRELYLSEGRMLEATKLEGVLDDILDKIEKGGLRNNHFYTQTWYMGNPRDYDLVVPLDELPSLMILLNEICELGLNREALIIHDNQTKVKIYSDMTHMQQRRVKKLYKVDYENGWCNIENRN